MFFSRRTVTVFLATAVALVKAQSESGQGQDNTLRIHIQGLIFLLPSRYLL